MPLFSAALDGQLRVFGQPIVIERDGFNRTHIMSIELRGRVYRMPVSMCEVEELNPVDILDRFARFIREERYANDHEGLGQAVTIAPDENQFARQLRLDVEIRDLHAQTQEEVNYQGIHFRRYEDTGRRVALPKIKALGTASLEPPKPKPKVRVIRFKKRLQSLAQKKE